MPPRPTRPYGYEWRGTVGVHGPSTANASASPGQGGVVNPTATSGSSLVERNWNLVPTGIVIATPGPDVDRLLLPVRGAATSRRRPR